MSAPFLKSGPIETQNIQLKRIAVKCTLVGSTTAANIYGNTDTADTRAYVEIGGVQPSTSGTGALLLEDSDANFGTLDSNAAPSTVGVLLKVGDALGIVSATVPTLTISSAQMTAGVVSLKGASTTGVTASNNIALLVSCTTLDLDSAIENHSFWVDVVYKSKLV